MNRRAMTYLARSLAPFALALASAVALAACQQQPAERPPLEGAALGGPFTLVDKAGRTVTWDQFKGRWRIVYFGYTFCPDACPLDMQALMGGFNRFVQDHPDSAAKVQPIFVSIDPERDTPEIVGQWTEAFGPRLLGLTGSPDQVKQAARAFAVYYAKGKDTSGGYLMDHTRTAFLMDPDGKPIAMVLPPEPGADPRQSVADTLAKWVK